MKRRGIAFRLAASILGGVLLIMAVVIGYTYQTMREGIVATARKENGQLARATANHIETVFAEAAQVARTRAVSLEESHLGLRQTLRLSHRLLDANPGLSGLAVAFAPYAHDPDIELYAPYTIRNNGEISSSLLGFKDWYPAMDWFQLARELDRPAWTEPYTDSSRRLMITYATPFARRIQGALRAQGNGALRTQGVVTVDIELAWLREMVSAIQVFKTGYVFLLSRYGTYIVHPNADLVNNETIFSYAMDTDLAPLFTLGKRMVAGDTGCVSFGNLPGTGACDVAFVPLPDQHWSLGVVLPHREMLADLNRLTITVAVAGVVGFLLLAGLIVFVSGTITKPLRVLREHTGNIARGDFSQALPLIVAHDEVGELTGDFERMRVALVDHVERLATTMAAKERIEAELHIARDIQMGILPKSFPAFPDRSEIDIFASILPAREVGGDLYDFFFIDAHRVCVLVGDVSGKGVPAAFFMAVTKTLIKATAEHVDDPGAILSKVNEDLARDNPSCMFVTIFLATLDVRTGELRYANAGHNPPLLITATRQVAFFGSMEEPMAGVMPGMDYGCGVRRMAPGDTVFLYTDGVSEAMNAAGDLYGEERIEAVLSRSLAEDPQALVREVERSVTEFVARADQSDDITMLAVRLARTTSQSGEATHED